MLSTGKAMLRRVFLAVFLILGLALPALAEKRVALVLGVDDYKKIRALENPVSDARAMEGLLEDLGFEVYLETDRDLKRMRRALDDFREDAAGADVALVFFAGHGVAIEGVNYLLPTDADASSSQKLKDSALALAEVQDVLNEVAKVSIVLLDACRDDPFAAGAVSIEGERGAAPLAEDPPEAPKPVPGLGRIGRADGTLFVFAAAPGETASDGNGQNSPFTAALMRHFGTAGVELKSALTLVQQDVYDRSRGKQLPYIESGLPELVFISAQSGEQDERTRLLMSMAGITPDLRAEVEEIATANDMPFAPLYGAVIDGNLGDLPSDQRRMKLEEAARAYTAFQTDLAKYQSDDPRVTELRVKAEELYSLGSGDEARALLDQAIEFDSESRELSKDTYLKRTLSLASSYVLKANVARTDLAYDLAIGDLTKAVELYAEIEKDLPDREAKLAYILALQDLGYLYSTTGDITAALSMHFTRSEFTQSLAVAEPFDIGWTRELIAALSSVGDVLQAMGYMREAEQEIMRGLEMTRAQSEANPDDLDLRRSLEIMWNQLGRIRYSLADYPGAVEAYTEALAIAEALLDTDPTLILYMRDVSFTQINLGDVYGTMGRYNEARDAYDVALRVAQQLTQEFPADNAFRQDLAVALERLGDMMIAERDFDTALAIYLESLKVREELNAADPGNVGLKRDFAVVYGKLGDIYSGLGDVGSALMSHEQARSINEGLVALDPANLDWMVNLSITLERIGQIYHDEGDYMGALAAFNECRDVRERILTVDPSSLPRQREMGVVLEKIGNTFAAMNDTVSALEVYQETLNLRRSLAEADPTVTLYREDTGWALVAVGDMLSLQGDKAGARAQFEEAARYFDSALADAPNSEGRLLNASVARNRLVDVLLALGEDAVALPVAEASVQLMDELLLIRPQGDLTYASDMVVALQRLGDAQMRVPDAVAAAATYRRMAEVGYAASAADPYNTITAQNYAVALEKLGDALMAQEDYAAARVELANAVAIRRWLVGQNPAVLREHRGLALVLQKEADTHYFVNDFDGGRPKEEEALTLMRWVMDQSPGDPWAVIDVVVGLDRVASYYDDVTPYYSEGLDLLEALIAQGGLPDPYYQQYVDKYREALGR